MQNAKCKMQNITVILEPIGDRIPYLNSLILNTGFYRGVYVDEDQCSRMTVCN
ncbi:hypothetical protein KAT63_04800 [Candidatus Parcubacteria bacterium]|nr:hypothetical protein [Candidatus Parcubacteria bacterium]